jgi:hypothetical protein
MTASLVEVLMSKYSFGRWLSLHRNVLSSHLATLADCEDFMNVKFALPLSQYTIGYRRFVGSDDVVHHRKRRAAPENRKKWWRSAVLVAFANGALGEELPSVAQLRHSVAFAFNATLAAQVLVTSQPGFFQCFGASDLWKGNIERRQAEIALTLGFCAATQSHAVGKNRNR